MFPLWFAFFLGAMGVFCFSVFQPIENPDDPLEVGLVARFPVTECVWVLSEVVLQNFCQLRQVIPGDSGASEKVQTTSPSLGPAG